MGWVQLTCIAAAGPASSFLVISDPEAAKHVLRASDNPNNPIYNKGLVAEVSQTCSREEHCQSAYKTLSIYGLHAWIMVPCISCCRRFDPACCDATPALST